MEGRSAFEVLGVGPETPDVDIKAAYRRLAKELHPDRNGGDPERAARFRAVVDAYRRLSTPSGRAEEVRRYGARRGRGDAESQWTKGPRDSGRARRHDGMSPRRPSRGNDLHGRVDLTLDFVLAGGIVEFELAEGPCSECGGRRWRRGVSPVPCPECGGEGCFRGTRGMMRVRIECRACNGTGFTTQMPCPACAGKGRVRGIKVPLTVPPGCEDGHSWRIEGAGLPGRDGGPAGDLVVTARIRPHPDYERVGNDLHRTVRIGVADAVLGTRLAFQGLDGDPVDIRIPPGTQPGDCLRITGRGMPDMSGEGRGDLLVEVRVALPTVLNEEITKAFERIREIEAARSLGS